MSKRTLPSNSSQLYLAASIPIPPFSLATSALPGRATGKAGTLFEIMILSARPKGEKLMKCIHQILQEKIQSRIEYERF
jgi:hypothetical protein